MERRKSGFTLIELLVVIAIIAILAAILFPVFMQAKQVAQKGVCVSNLKEIFYAYSMYMADCNGYYPSNDFGANLFLIEPYLKGQRRFKLSDYSSGFDKTVWLCPVATGKYGLWYKVRGNYWVDKRMKPPWYAMGINEDTCRIFNSYVLNDDVTSIYTPTGWRPAGDGKVRQPSRTVFFAEGSYNPYRRGTSNFQLGTSPTATHPTLEKDEVTSGWYPGVPSTSRSDIQAWHSGGANFLFVDSHVKYFTEVPPYEQWKVEGTVVN